MEGPILSFVGRGQSPDEAVKQATDRANASLGKFHTAKAISTQTLMPVPHEWFHVLTIVVAPEE